MSDVHIDENAFHKRLSIVQRFMVQELLAQAVIFVGARDDDNTYKKSTVLQTWLLGYEFIHTAIYLTQNSILFITSEGKAKYLKSLQTKPTANSSSVEIWPTNKDQEHTKSLLVKLATKIKETDPKCGGLLKDVYAGKFIDAWKLACELEKFEGPAVDIGLILSQSMEIKDEDELNNINIASKASTVMMDNFVDEMSLIVDEEKKVSNLELTDRLEDKIESNKWYRKNDLGKKLLGPLTDFDQELVEWCYSPIVQSGGAYELKPNAISSEDRLIGDGVILSSIGLRYKSYCSNLARTFLIDPTPEMELNYDFLCKLQSHVCDTLLKEGNTGNQVFEGALEYIKKEKPDLVTKFTKNCGWQMGIEFRDSLFVLNAKNQRPLKSGQVISLWMGFSGLPNEHTKNPKLKQYALLLADTFRITESQPILLTTYTKARAEVSFYFRDEPKATGAIKVKLESSRVPKAEAKTPSRGAEQNSKVLKSKLRREGNSGDDSANAEKVRQEVQSQLHAKRLQEGLARFSKADATADDDYKPVFKKYESYVRELQIPSSVRDLKIHVDYRAQTIILPICGRPVPFHINTFKNGSQNEEGDYTYLRLNFHSPGAGGFASKRSEVPYEDTPDASFLRSVTLRSRDRQRMIDVYKAIQDLKKDGVKRDQEKKQMADVVTQASLVEIKGSRVKKLDQVFVRPQPDSKKIGGVLQIHENGLRYQSSFKLDQKVDVLFSNIKHLFFQSCKDELIVIIHCHLKNPIMIGKKKTYDVQFYREASDMAFDETGGRKRKYRYGDEDELQQEQEERKRKAMLDKEFRQFAELISELSRGMVDLDIPFRELGFQGVPFRSAVLCIPTRDCLVQLIDPPYLVVTLEEIEIAHLERVQFGLKNFDLVFVPKDFNKPVIHINTIPMEVLEDVKSWLTDVDIPLSEGQMNLNWATIMKTVQSDPYQFFVDGGWSFLTGLGDSLDEDLNDEESEFEVTDEDPSDEDDASEGSEGDYSSGGSDLGLGLGLGLEAESEEEGEDWDELEKKAAREDKQFGRE